MAVRHPILRVELHADLHLAGFLVIDTPALDARSVGHQVEEGVERGTAVWKRWDGVLAGGG